MLKKIIAYLGGNSFSQIILLLAIPFLVKIYTVEQFGAYGIFGAYLAILSQINGLKFENTIISNKRAKVHYYYASCISIAIVVSVVLFFASIFIYSWPYAVILILSSLFAYIVNSFQLFLVKIEKASLAGYLSIVRSLLLILSQFFFAESSFINVNGLVFGCFVSLALLGIPLLVWSLYLMSKIKVRSQFKVIHKNFEFIRYVLPQTLLNNVSVQLPVFFIESLWGVKAVGIYTMALKIVQVPSRFMATVLRNLLTTEFSKVSHKSNHCYMKAKTYTFYLSIISFLFFGFLGLYIPYIIELFLGSEWKDVVLIVRCMLVWFAISFINIPAFAIVMVYKKLKFLLSFETIGFVFRLFLFVFFSLASLEFYLGVFILSLSIAALNIYFIVNVLIYKRVKF